MKTAKWSDLLRPMARRRCAILLARASNCPCVIVSPDWAMMIAGWLGSAVKSCSIGPPLLFVLSTPRAVAAQIFRARTLDELGHNNKAL